MRKNKRGLQIYEREDWPEKSAVRLVLGNLWACWQWKLMKMISLSQDPGQVLGSCCSSVCAPAVSYLAAVSPVEHDPPTLSSSLTSLTE